jgi:catechol 2,3-dioxygenase-like lactoylglutathione lyase family enzyme
VRHISIPSWRFDHISAVTLAVRDMAESVAFYARLGLEVEYGGPHAAFTTMRAGQSFINLREAPGSAHHRGIRVILRVQGVDALHGNLVEKAWRPPNPGMPTGRTIL